MFRTIEVSLKSILLFLGILVSSYIIPHMYQIPVKHGWETYAYRALILMLIVQIICIRIIDICNIYYLWDKNRKHKKAMKAYLKYVKDPEVSKVIRKIYAKIDWDYDEDILSDSKFQFRPTSVQFNYRLRQILTQNIYLYTKEGSKPLKRKLDEMFEGTNFGESLLKLNQQTEASKSNYIQVSSRNSYNMTDEIEFKFYDNKETYYDVDALFYALYVEELRDVFKERWFEHYFQSMAQIVRPDRVITYILVIASIAAIPILLPLNSTRTLFFVLLFFHYPYIKHIRVFYW